jgi:hypothetical protein
VARPDGVDRRPRCVTNRVDDVDAHWLRMRFDPPPDGTELEGVGGYARVSSHVGWIRAVCG